MDDKSTQKSGNMQVAFLGGLGILKLQYNSILTKCIYGNIINFEWDENKNRANILKHGIDFADVYRVFDGPMIVQLDDRNDYEEVRWRGTGYLANNIVIVVYAELDGDTIRLISARKALRHERRRFEQELKNRLG